MNHVSLFSGIGGQSIACDWLGITTVGFCEIESWSRRVLAKHWPEAGFHDDIKTLTGDIVRRWTGGGQLGLLTASWPCQPFSVAGQRRGKDDDRALWPEVARIIDETRPEYFLGENVPGIISMELDDVLADMEDLGYTAGAIVVPAGSVNALHRRDRVWIMAHRDGEHSPERGERKDTPQEGASRRDERGGSNRHARQVTVGGAGKDTICDSHASGERELQPQGTEQNERRRTGDLGEGMAHTIRQRQQGSRAQEHARDPEAYREGQAGDAVDGGAGGEGPEVARTVDPRSDGIRPGLVRRPAARSPWDDPDMIRAMWVDGSWEHDLPRVVTEEPERRQKLMAAGNAIVPAVAYEILRVMLAEEIV